MAGRVSQQDEEALVGGGANARTSQQVNETLAQGGAIACVTQQDAEALASGGALARASQQAREALVAGGKGRITQLVLECLVHNLEPLVPIIFPTLPGRGFSTHWKPQFANMKSAQPSAGGSIDLALSDVPTHQFELVFNFLRDRPGWQGGTNGQGAISSIEWRILAGFVLQMNGTSGRCLFKWEDDCKVRSQTIGTTDGTTRAWTLQRTLGAGGYGSTEPIGWLDLTEPFNLYLNGVWQDPNGIANSYTLLTSIGGEHQVQFGGPPAAEQAISVDMSYFYYCKLAENSQDFEKFMNHLWKVGKLSLESVLAGQ